MQKAKDKYHNCGGKEEAAGYYLQNKDVIKEKANNKVKTLSEKEKDAKKKNLLITEEIICPLWLKMIAYC